MNDMSAAIDDVLPRDRPACGGRYENYARPGDVGAELAEVNREIFAGEYVYIVEQTHAIDLNLAERPELVTEARHLPAPDFGMGEQEKRELGKAVKKLGRTV